MKISTVNLKNHEYDVLRALDRNENVVLLHNGKEKYIIKPIKSNVSFRYVQDHPIYGLCAGAKSAVINTMSNLRNTRY